MSHAYMAAKLYMHVHAYISLPTCIANGYEDHDHSQAGCTLQYEVPPRDLQVKVRVVQELGEVMLSVGPTYLAHGSVHSLPRHEVERFLRAGDLEVLDLIRE